MADTTVTSLRLKTSQYKLVKELADFHGVTVTTFMRNTILERLEDENDYKDAVESVKSSDGKVVTREEIMSELGMEP
ncbi:MAG: DUF6290 family protein [Lacticaseibacillus songhuajiangensis]|jgi:predicted DNA-binding protein|nr:DUF6290 family protein [Lacticaseibacillus songhuajiangensis]